MRQLLSERQKLRIIDASRVPSAVLLPLYCREGQYHILFTKRTDNVSTHKGQISFPGGAREEGDRTLADTALRESSEEIGLKPEDVEILGELDDRCSIASSYVITPFVALIPWPYQFRLSQREIKRIIEAPIAALLDKDCQSRGTETRDDNVAVSYFYTYEDSVIWGATAGILNQFLGIFARLITEKGDKESRREAKPPCTPGV